MTNDDKRIKRAFKPKSWNETKTNDSWAIFKIMSEFVDGFEKLSRIKPCVSIFGSARFKDDHPSYIAAEEIAYQLSQNGYGVVTGGGCHSTASATDFEASNKGMLHCVYFLSVSEANIRFINKHYPLPSIRDH